MNHSNSLNTDSFINIAHSGSFVNGFFKKVRSKANMTNKLTDKTNTFGRFSHKITVERFLNLGEARNGSISQKGTASYMNKQVDFAALAAQFRFRGEFIYAEPFGEGHIHDTYAIYFKGRYIHPRRYILQRINTEVFKNPDALMDNIERVTAHLRKKIRQAGGNVCRETLTVVRTVEGGSMYADANGDCWRAYLFIDDSTTFQSIEEPECFFQSARAFGRFIRQLDDFPVDTLHETIPNFHHTESRFEALVKAVIQDKAGRAVGVEKEIDFAMRRKTDASVLTGLLSEGKLPLRVTHNDTKLNNVLIDNATGQSVCVVDLDTVMPGLSLYDFGDAIRFGASTAAEDEKDLTKVCFSPALFEAFTKGFLMETGEVLWPLEIDLLPFGAKIMTFECGIRFLTDYLNGDTYFKIHYSDHNLDRCRTQFKLVQEMEEKADQMMVIVGKYRK